MATASGNFYGGYSKQSRLRLYWEYTQDIANNCDYFYLALYAQKPSGMGTHTNNYHNSKYFITGFSEDKLINGTGDFSWGNTTEMFIGESSFTHYHDNSGNSGDVYVGGNWFTNLTSSSVVGTNLYVEGYVTGIPKIPRYVNITSFSVSKRDETSVLFNWSADANCDWAWFSTDGGNTWSSLNNDNIVRVLSSDTSRPLSPNTTYNFKLRLRRTDSQLTTDSGTYAQTTYDYPKPTSINDFVIGEGATVTLYNPLNRKCKLEIISREDNSVLGTYEGTYAGNVNAEFKTESAIDAQYKSIPNSQSGKYYAKVTYGNSVKTKGDKTYSVKADECYPEFQNFEYEDISVNTLNLTENNQLLINNYSECQFKIAVANKAIAKKYASIAYYYCTWGNKSVNINEDSEKDVIGSILGGTGGTLKVVAVDSRGLRSQVDTTINVPFIPYTSPIISNLETQRKDGVDIETYIAFKINMFNGNWDNESKENTLVAVKYRAKFGDEEYGEWGDITDTVLALTPYINGDVKTYTLSLYNKTLIHSNGSSGGFEAGKAYTVQLMVQDGYDTYYLETIYSTTDVIDGKIGMSRYKDSNGDYHYGINRMPDPNCNFVTDKASFGGDYNPIEGGCLQVNGINIEKLTGNMSGDTLPIGSVMEWFVETIPVNWLRLDGQAVSRTDYKDLFALYGTTYGAGDGSTTFNLPDMRTRVPVGKTSADSDFNALGKKGGEKTHTLTVAEMPSHYHDHDYYVNSGLEGGYDKLLVFGSLTAQSHRGAATYTAGSSQSHNNLQPYIAVHFIVKAKQSSGVVANVVDLLTSTSTTDALSANQGKVLNEKAQKHVMTINAQRYWRELNNTWTFYPITNMSVYSSTGTKLSFTDNAIKIGKGVSKVLVSGTGDWNHGHTCDRCLQIYKNSDVEVASNYHGQETTNYVSSSISPKALDVKENDLIKIGVLTQTPSNTEILSAFLTVEVIE